VKVLLDACVWMGARQDLVAAGHEVVHAGEWPEDPGDEVILARAYDQERVLVTLDKDFGELAIVHRKPHKGIVRLVDIPARSQGAMCITILDRHGESLVAGAIVTASLTQVRIRLPDKIDENADGSKTGQPR
jgi:predicted nuclease of predicted toxin-antitoxin system